VRTNWKDATMLVSCSPPAPRLPSPPVSVAIAAAGPTALGAIISLRLANPAPAIAIPAVVLGVAAATLPALYIATAVTGAAPPLDHVARAVGRALFALGLAALGLAAPLLFLTTTTTDAGAAYGLTSVALVTALAIGLRVLHRELWGPGLRTIALDLTFLAWAVSALIIGARLYAELAAGVAP
jgi:hypothetical protein